MLEYRYFVEMKGVGAFQNVWDYEGVVFSLNELEITFVVVLVFVVVLFLC